MRKALIAALFLAVPVTAGAQAGRDAETWSWSGRVAAGAWMRTFNVNGSIEVETSPDNQVRVVATKQVRRGGDRRDVSFAVVERGGNVTVCAMFNEEATCEENDYSSNTRRNRENRVTVNFKVQVPRGVKIGANTVNGSIEVLSSTEEVVATTVKGGVDVRNAKSRVKARTVNGDVDVITSTGPVSANTVNGSVNARMSTLAGGDDMSFSTTNGSVNLELPASFDADVSLQTVNGRITTDFPLTITGRFGPRHASGVIGKGGRRLRAHTTNGSVSLSQAR